MTRTELIAYDITDDARRTRVCKAILSRGERLQYSIFVVSGNRVFLEQLHSEIHSLIDHGIDRVLAVDLGAPGDAQHRLTTWGAKGVDLCPPTHYAPW